MWLRHGGVSKGAVVQPQTLYELGAKWYANRFDIEFEPLTVHEKQALFESHGMRGAFWSIT